MSLPADVDGDLAYRINERDEIVFVNEEWDRFAAGNGGERVLGAQVLHHSLWDFITDQTTLLLYRDVLKRIRNGRLVQFTFRCDSPACRRLLMMSVARRDDGLIEFRTRPISQEPRPPIAVLAPHAAHSDTLLRVCSWCCRIDAGGEWVEVEEAITRLQLLEQPLLPMITHGICESCYETVFREFAEAS